MTLGQRQPVTDHNRSVPRVGLVLPFGVRRPEATSPDGMWETVARIPAVRPTRPSDEPTLELPVVRIDGAPGVDGSAPAPMVFEDPGVVSFAPEDARAHSFRPTLVSSPGAAPVPVDEVAGDRGSGAGGGGATGAWWLAAGHSGGRVTVMRAGDRSRSLLATLVETALELLVALLRLLLDGVAALYRILQRFGTAAVIVSMVVLALRMIPWGEIASFVQSLSAPP